MTPLLTVSDTAFAAAACRALEGVDAMAAQLAGARGVTALAAVPGLAVEARQVAARSVAFDLQVMTAVAEGVDTVVNLGCGLDSRAYRLPLPRALRWFDVDVPEVLARRAQALADDAPRCAHEDVALDLAGPGLAAFLADVGASRALVLSEGLLPYLSPLAAGRLAAALYDAPGFGRWVLSLPSPAAAEQIRQMVGLDEAFGADDPALFERLGFAVADSLCVTGGHLLVLERGGRAAVTTDRGPQAA